MDVTPTGSLAAFSPRPGLIILRPLGKFFGLAGARVGFVLAEDGFLHRLNEKLGPWMVSRQAGGTALFKLMLTRQTVAICDGLARQGVLVRLFAEPANLRFGLPVNEAEWRRPCTARAASAEDAEIVA